MNHHDMLPWTDDLLVIAERVSPGRLRLAALKF
jgi:hypothetical protein